MEPGSAALITSDPEGRNFLDYYFDGQKDKDFQKDLAFKNYFGSSVYIHYPVKPHINFELNSEAETLEVKPINEGHYRSLSNCAYQNNGKYFVSEDLRIHVMR